MLRALADEVLALVVPPACLACRRPLTRAGEVLCACCRRGLPWLPDVRCPRCALPAPCRPCPAARAPFGRGLDQADRLARALARRTGLPGQAALRRSGSGVRQVGASRAARLAPGRLNVVAAGPAPAEAVLVDDVHTTGATLRAGAAALRAAGAERVVCVTYARALRRG